ncbi:unnamed protein product [Chrysoparadoxa australica]
MIGRADNEPWEERNQLRDEGGHMIKKDEGEHMIKEELFDTQAEAEGAFIDAAPLVDQPQTPSPEQELCLPGQEHEVVSPYFSIRIGRQQRTASPYSEANEVNHIKKAPQRFILASSPGNSRKRSRHDSLYSVPALTATSPPEPSPTSVSTSARVSHGRWDTATSPGDLRASNTAISSMTAWSQPSQLSALEKSCDHGSSPSRYRNGCGYKDVAICLPSLQVSVKRPPSPQLLSPLKSQSPPDAGPSPSPQEELLDFQETPVAVSLEKSFETGSCSDVLASTPPQRLSSEKLSDESPTVSSEEAEERESPQVAAVLRRGDTAFLDVSQDPSIHQDTLRTTKLTTQDLAKAKVIAQVDAKFIVLLVDSLVLCVDQHAADERVKLEELEDKVFQCHPRHCVRGVKLSTPKLVGVTPHDAHLLVTHKDVLSDWRFGYNLQPNCPESNGSSSVQLVITTVPEILNVRLSTADLLSLVHFIEAHSGMAKTARPPLVQHILQYKACHGAIRFGQVLSHQACCDLITKLSRCRFPFNCAHGRISIVPLCSMEGGE